MARYGGEEFVVILAGAGKKEAFDVAEKMRVAIEKTKFVFKDKTVGVTISGGVVQYSNEKTREELVEKADSVLYRAKHEGKNKICLYGA